MAGVQETWVTGIGLVSSLGEGASAHGRTLSRALPEKTLVDADNFKPYCVHPLIPTDLSIQIPSKSDLRQMGRWQQIGTYAAGLALADAGLAGRDDLLDNTDIVAAAGNGDRDTAFDAQVLEDGSDLVNASPNEKNGAYLNGALHNGLRPTLYLCELSNLLAGNIQIVHKVTGSSRTLKGEEMAGASAIENAVRRVASGQAEVVLVGGALNAERKDLLLGYELDRNLWSHPFRPVWQRRARGGGFVPGSAGVFLVIESRRHAEARGAEPYARISAAVTSCTRRARPGRIRDSLTELFEPISRDLWSGPLAVLSGASGVEPATAEELEFLEGLDGDFFMPVVRAYGSRLGHTVEAHFPLGVALGAIAIAQRRFFQPFERHGNVEVPLKDGQPIDRVLVTGVGHWRGEGLAIIERVPHGRAL